MTVQLLTGDCREVLRAMADGSVQTCVTSPPYFGLRDYGVAGQIGLESSLDAYVAELVAVFREVKRVLADDGTLWLNLGDSYASGGSRSTGRNDESSADLARRFEKYGTGRPKASIERDDRRTFTVSEGSCKPKDLLGVPWRVAFALQADGWYLRSDIVWHKPNPMPESVTDRPTSAYEHIFLLTKSGKYFYDADAIREPNETESNLRNKSAETWGQLARLTPNGHGEREWNNPAGRNARNVWTIATAGFSDAHFAVFPPEIPRRCILAGSREGDTVLDPFAGAGTTLLVADRLGRNAVGVEVNPEYVRMAQKRITNDAPLFVDLETA